MRSKGSGLLTMRPALMGCSRLSTKQTGTVDARAIGAKAQMAIRRPEVMRVTTGRLLLGFSMSKVSRQGDRLMGPKVTIRG